MALVLPSWPAGHEITGAETTQVMTAIQQCYGVRGSVSVTQFVNNSTTLVNVTGLSFALEASSSYRIFGHLIMQGGTVGDIKLAATVPTGSSGYISADGQATTDTGNFVAKWSGANNSFATVMAFGGNNATVSLFYSGVITTSSAGTYQVQFAQNAADAGANTTIWAGSWVTFYKD